MCLFTSQLTAICLFCRSHGSPFPEFTTPRSATASVRLGLGLTLTISLNSKFHLARHVTCRHDATRSTCRARRDERVEPCCSTSSTQPKCVGSTRSTWRVVSRCDVTSQVEFGLNPKLLGCGPFSTMVVSYNKNNGKAAVPSGNWCLAPSTGYAFAGVRDIILEKNWDCVCKIMQSSPFWPENDLKYRIQCVRKHFNSGTPFTCVPAAFEEREQRCHLFLLEMTPGGEPWE